MKNFHPLLVTMICKNTLYGYYRNPAFRACSCGERCKYENNQPTIEHRRLKAQRKSGENWQLWGSYLLGAVEIIGLVLTNEQAVLTQGYCEAIFKQRHQEADKFYQSLLPANASRKDQRIFRPAMAGMIWNK